MKEKVVKQTIVIIPDNTDERASISTTSRKWQNRMEELEQAGRAEEVESDIEGAREWEFGRELVHMPYVRKAREWTEEQKEASRERLADVRASVKAAREAEAKKAGKKGKAAPAAPVAEPKSVKKAAAAVAGPKKKVAAPPPPAKAKKGASKAKKQEEFEDDEDDDLDDLEDDLDDEDEDLEDDLDDLEDDDEDEVVVKGKKPAAKGKGK